MRERTPQGGTSRFAPPNFSDVGSLSLASSGGEGWGEEAPGMQLIGRSMERTPQGGTSRFAPPNFNDVGGFSLASFGGEGWGEEAPDLQSIGRFVERRLAVSSRSGGLWGGGRILARFFSHLGASLAHFGFQLLLFQFFETHGCHASTGLSPRQILSAFRHEGPPKAESLRREDAGCAWEGRARPKP